MDALDLDRISHGAQVGAVQFHDEIDSTNTRALEMVAAESPLLPHLDVVFPLLVLAERQRAGRGRGQNRWWAGPGALTFSVVVNGPKIQLSTRDWPLISLATGLAVAETLEMIGTANDVQLKWPNDVLLAGRKVCGILVENTSKRPGQIVVGVGLNVNNSFRDAPAELQPTGISIVDYFGRTVHRTDVLIGILQRMANQFEALHHREQLADVWRTRCALQGRTVTVLVGSQSIAGVCQGIDETGALLLQTECGIERCYGGTVAKVL